MNRDQKFTWAMVLASTTSSRGVNAARSRARSASGSSTGVRLRAWAYSAAAAAVVLAAVVVAVWFPRKDEERAVLARYAAEDAVPSGTS